MRKFTTGAVRDSDEGKIDYQGFLSQKALKRFGQYMLKHQRQADGAMRASDNWKKGIPQEAYVKSLYRHIMEFMEKAEDPAGVSGDLQDIACAILFNVQGWIHEDLKGAQAAQGVRGAEEPSQPGSASPLGSSPSSFPEASSSFSSFSSYSFSSPQVSAAALWRAAPGPRARWKGRGGG